MLSNEGERLERAVVCTPRREYALGAGEPEKHNIGELGAPGIAVRQHDVLKSTLREFGTQVIDVVELEGHPNSVFVRDTAVCTPRGYVKLRLGLETRQGEDDWMAELLEELGEPCVGEIREPGTVEGGDIVLAGEVAFIGRSIRTNQEGIRQLSGVLKKMGYEIRVIELLETILHLDKALMVLGPRQVLYCQDQISEKEIEGFERVGILGGGNTTANIICLGEGELIVNRSNSLVADLLAERGYQVHALELGEFAKGMGGPNCLIMPVKRGA